MLSGTIRLIFASLIRGILQSINQFYKIIITGCFKLVMLARKWQRWRLQSKKYFHGHIYDRVIFIKIERFLMSWRWLARKSKNKIGCFYDFRCFTRTKNSFSKIHELPIMIALIYINSKNSKSVNIRPKFIYLNTKWYFKNMVTNVSRKSEKF